MAYDYSDYQYISRYPSTFYPQSQPNPGKAQLEYNAYTSFKSIVGREPTEDEFTSAANIFVNSGSDTGYQYLTNLKAQIAATPTASQQTVIDKVNDLNAQSAVAQAQAQLTLSQAAVTQSAQVAAQAVEATSAVNPPYAGGGLPLGFSSPVPGDTPPAPSKAPYVAVVGVILGLLYYFRKKIF